LAFINLHFFQALLKGFGQIKKSQSPIQGINNPENPRRAKQIVICRNFGFLNPIATTLLKENKAQAEREIFGATSGVAGS